MNALISSGTNTVAFPIKNSENPLQAIENTALGYLSRRDYSRLELYQRLISKGYQSYLINDVLDKLQEDNYQSDERFAECYIRSRVDSGDGPLKIKIALRGKGICDSLTLALMDKLAINWFDQVKLLKEKRFGDVDSNDLNEITQQARYLKNKGFYQEHIESVISYIF
ncbi:MAG: regulatory protein RecX [Pseudomonadota bacterium]